MLGKLIKHDFKSSSHSMLAVYVAAIALCGIATIPFFFEKMEIIQALSFMMLGLSSWIMLILPIFLLLSYFNRSLYSNQGYLTYTLPVKSRDLLFSKAIVTLFWITLSYIFFVGIWVYAFFLATISTKENYEMVVDAFKQLIEAFAMVPIDELIKVLAKIVITIVAVFFFEIVVIVSQIFFSITLSNIKPFSYLGGFGGILLFGSISIAMIITFGVLTFLFPCSLYFDMATASIKLVWYSMLTTPYTLGLGGMIFQLLASVGMFIGTNYLMKKKVNIK